MKSYSKLLDISRLIATTGLFQGLIQLVGFINGILIIRLLSVNEYALYILANTMLGTMTILADGGIAAGVMAEGGKVWNNQEKLGSVLVTGLHLRRRFALGSLLVSIPILIYLLRHNEASWLTTGLIVLSVIPALYATLSDSLLEVAPKLHQSIIPLQKNQAYVGSIRLIFSALTLFIFPWAFVAVLAGGLPRIYGNIELRKISNKFADISQMPNPEVKEKILGMVKRILPGAFYFSFSGQISIWLISVFGNVEAVGQLGAIGRIAMLLNIMNVLTSTIIVPRFARMAENRSILLIQYIKIMASLFLLSSFICIFVYAIPDKILWILGKDYANLQNELLLIIVAACINMLSGIAFSLYTVRSWVIHPAILISFNLVSMLILILINKVETLHGVLIYGVELSIASLIINTTYCLIKIIRLPKGT